MIVTTSRALLISSAVGVFFSVAYSVSLNQNSTSMWTILSAGILFANVSFRCHLLLRYFEFAQIDQQARHAKQQRLIRREKKQLLKVAKMQQMENMTSKKPEKKQRKPRAKKSLRTAPHVVYVWNDAFGPNPRSSSTESAALARICQIALARKTENSAENENGPAKAPQNNDDNVLSGALKVMKLGGIEPAAEVDGLVDETGEAAAVTIRGLTAEEESSESSLRSLASIDELVTRMDYAKSIES
jgi:hypothetical protein